MLLFFVCIVSAWLALWTEHAASKKITSAYYQAALESALRRRSMIDQTMRYIIRLLTRDPAAIEQLQNNPEGVWLGSYDCSGVPVTYPIELSFAPPDAYVGYIVDKGQRLAAIHIVMGNKGCHVHIDLL
jgi:hypothetical protein